MISKSQIEQYNDEGYTIVENVFNADEMNPILDEFEEIVDDFAEKAFLFLKEKLHSLAMNKYHHHLLVKT